MQKRRCIEASVDPRDLDDITTRKQRRILHAEAIDLNGKRKEGEGEPSDLDLLSRFLLEIGDYLAAVTIHVDESWYGKKQCCQEYGCDNENGRAADGHSNVEIGLLPGNRNRTTARQRAPIVRR